MIALHSLGLDNFCVMWDPPSEAHATGRQSPRGDVPPPPSFFKLFFVRIVTLVTEQASFSPTERSPFCPLIYNRHKHNPLT